MKFILCALIPLVLSLGIISITPSSFAEESNQICIDKVWIENTKGKIACVKLSTAEMLVDRGWGTMLDDSISEPPSKACTKDYRPVCGIDEKTYGNMCTLESFGVNLAYNGECKINSFSLGEINTEEYDHADVGYGNILGGNPNDNSQKFDKVDVEKPSDEQIKNYDAWFVENQERHLNEVSDLVAFPTLAMVPGNENNIKNAGNYLKDKLVGLGFENAKVHSLGNLVTAEWMGAGEDQPIVLFYGHYDIQPVDESRWDSDPFKTETIDGKMYGRGATDDKGPIISLLSAFEVMLELDNEMPVNIRVIFDGEEEFGSQNMPEWLEDPENKKYVSTTDYGFNVDAMMYSDTQGLMWKGLRGGSDVEVTLTSANTALHSGIYGGVAPNSAVAASKIISSMWNDDGTVAIEGFYDDVKALTDKERDSIALSVEGMDEAMVRGNLDITEWIGEDDFTLIERTWIRPSLDVTGLKSGYVEGKASTIPFDSWFRVQVRTAAGQDPEIINQSIMTHIEKQVPWGLKVEMSSGTAGSAPFLDENDLNFRIGQTVLTEYFGNEPLVLYVGGGVPALSHIPGAGGPNLVSFAFQRSDEGFHADNEFMRISSFETGQRAYTQLLHALVDQPKRN